jgi:hypothetical protein
METIAALPPKVGGGGALEEAVVGASCRATTMTSAYRATVEACFSSRRRAMVCTWARASAAFLSVAWKAANLSKARCYRAAAVSLAASSPTIEGAGAVETSDPEEGKGGDEL